MYSRIDMFWMWVHGRENSNVDLTTTDDWAHEFARYCVDNDIRLIDDLVTIYDEWSNRG